MYIDICRYIYTYIHTHAIPIWLFYLWQRSLGCFGAAECGHLQLSHLGLRERCDPHLSGKPWGKTCKHGHMWENYLKMEDYMYIYIYVYICMCIYIYICIISREGVIDSKEIKYCSDV